MQLFISRPKFIPQEVEKHYSVAKFIILAKICYFFINSLLKIFQNLKSRCVRYFSFGETAVEWIICLVSKKEFMAYFSRVTIVSIIFPSVQKSVNPPRNVLVLLIGPSQSTCEYQRHIFQIH
jgi:hypothetical protein